MVHLTADRGASKPSAAVPVLAMMDSGADRCLFPMQIAGRLGLIGKYDMNKDARKSSGVGSEFETYSSTIPIRAQIVASVQMGAAVVQQAWGPQLTLTPAFAKAENFLLGRADFFKAFTVSFEEARSVFHLDY
jgi:hypothetical protein